MEKDLPSCLSPKSRGHFSGCSREAGPPGPSTHLPGVPEPPGTRLGHSSQWGLRGWRLASYPSRAYCSPIGCPGRNTRWKAVPLQSSRVSFSSSAQSSGKCEDSLKGVMGGRCSPAPLDPSTIHMPLSTSYFCIEMQPLQFFLRGVPALSPLGSLAPPSTENPKTWKLTPSLALLPIVDSYNESPALWPQVGTCLRPSLPSGAFLQIKV